jgi:hypothetical protein
MVTLRSVQPVWIICIFIGAGFITGTAFADILLYGTTNNGDSGTSTLVTIDPSDGTASDPIGSGVDYLVNGMAWDYHSQRLYASTSPEDPAFTGLIIIDRASGVGTAVGTPDWGRGPGFSVSNITIDSDGNMVGWADTNPNQLVEIDKETGEIIPLIDIGVPDVPVVYFGLSYDKLNVLYLVNCSVSDDGSTLYVFDDKDKDFREGPIVEHESRQGDFHPTSNRYYGIDHTGVDTRKLVSFDVVDNTGNNYKDSFETVDRLHTLAFAVTSSSGSSDSGGGTCFIRSITGTH